jgi:hypothetical protein
MNSHIQITLVAGPQMGVDDSTYGTFVTAIKNVHVIGANLHYGINRIPMADVQIEPTGGVNNTPDALKALCDFDVFRRQPVILTVKTPQSCIVFNGLIDGNSISQTPGGLSTSFIVKHVYTLLSEVYPRILGAAAGTSNMFALPQGVSIGAGADSTASDTSAFGTSNPFFQTPATIFNVPLKWDQPAIPLIIDFCKATIQQQQNAPSLIAGKMYSSQIGSNQTSLLPVLCAVSINAQQLAPTILTLLDHINTSFTSGFSVNGCDPIVGSQIQDHIAVMEENMLSSLIHILSEYKCALIVGNETAFIVPHTPYLKTGFNLPSPIPISARSNQPNLALPADYESFSFNDAGENTIKGVYVVHEAMDTQVVLDAAAQGGINGFYGEDLNISSCAGQVDVAASSGNNSSNSNHVFGSFVMKTLPNLAANYMSSAAFHNCLQLQQAISSARSISLAPSNPIQPADAITAIQQCQNTNSVFVTQLKDYLNQWAQMEYCQIKYGDRTGNISMPFNNNWVPGAPGSLYTRNPGVWIDFFVTDITHSFTISAPNRGQATTSVSFNGGRMGGSINQGLDQVDLFKYSFSDSQQFCQAFLGDISNP